MKKIVIIIIIAFIIGFGSGLYAVSIFNNNVSDVIADDLALDEQEATIRAIKKVRPAVVSIIVYDYEDFLAWTPAGQEVQKHRKQMIKGTGFLISADGFIITNKHVINTAKEETGEYRIILNSGKEYYAQLIGQDPLNDLAVLKIFDKDLPLVELGDSDRLELGTSVIAIGNALGRYENSATKGIVSALGRSLIASDQSGNSEALDNVIQTDAKINIGNSGGPLINLAGRVVGINTAVEQAGSAIGFAIPINDARTVIQSIKTNGYIARPMIGVRYQMITPEIALDYKLSRDSGAWISPGSEDTPGVLPDSPADRAGLAEGDIIFEINAIKIEGKNTLLAVIQKFKPRDKIGLKIQRGDKVIIRVVELGEFR